MLITFLFLKAVELLCQQSKTNSFLSWCCFFTKKRELFFLAIPGVVRFTKIGTLPIITGQNLY